MDENFNWEEWKDKTNEIAKKNKVCYRIVNIKFYYLIFAWLILFLILSGVFGFYYLKFINNGKLNTIIDQPINNNINTTNEYSFNPIITPTNNNEYKFNPNYTIIINNYANCS